MRVQILNNVITAWGIAVTGIDTYSAPEDYSPRLYIYVGNEDFSFNPEGFFKIES